MELIFAWIYFLEVKKINFWREFIFANLVFPKFWRRLGNFRKFDLSKIFARIREADLDIKQKISKENKKTVFLMSSICRFIYSFHTRNNNFYSQILFVIKNVKNVAIFLLFLFLRYRTHIRILKLQINQKG